MACRWRARIPATMSMYRSSHVFFFNDTATTEIYTLSLHDALPISQETSRTPLSAQARAEKAEEKDRRESELRSEEHTSELQSRQYLVCRLLLEKKNIQQILRVHHDQPYWYSYNTSHPRLLSHFTSR